MLMRIALTLLALTVAAPAAAQTAAQSEADTKELASYRLTVDGLNKVKVATRAMYAAMKTDPEFQELAKVTAEMRAIMEKEEPTDADFARMEELGAKQEALSQGSGLLDLGEGKSLTEMEQQLEASSAAAAGLRAAGMTAREYTKFMVSMIQAAMAAGMKKAGMLTEVPADIPAENVAFVLEHEAELKAMQEELSGLDKE